MPASVPLSTLHFWMHPGYDYRAKQEVIIMGTWCDYYATMCERTSDSAGMAYSGCGKNENQVGNGERSATYDALRLPVPLRLPGHRGVEEEDNG